ncbi:Phosphopantothenoylcysteine decarboxylase / Phosphopantothenoylcysteine synthetase, partial [hydrothermal vent metagenome]
MKASLHNKNILLGVCGGIAAYKSADLVRRLQDAGADVHVIMTPGAQKFITPLTFQALSGHTTHTDLLDSEAENAMGHIELARWADLILVAPATANSIALFASGRADNLLAAVCLASKAKIAIAPAMNHVMWKAEATQQNIQQLQQYGVHIFGPDTGSQACGEVGEGRLQEIDLLVKNCTKLFGSGLLQGLNLMITAGPTFEPIDPVRFIGNRSSGRMGFAM